MSSGEQVFIGLGSNLRSSFGGRRSNIETALRRLSELEGLEVITISSLYVTKPVGVEDQGLFLNAAAELATEIEPEPLLNAMLAIEDGMGRVRTRRWGPRVIDLDLLFFGQRIMGTRILTLPHPELPHREFVLAPLSEIAPQVVHPVSKRTVAELSGTVAGQGVSRLEKSLICLNTWL